ncbi:MAG: DUF354 domain-containing protein [Cytophagales bacterium]|nr:DUF354 domain-containing protein [Cytophagales bacterium]
MKALVDIGHPAHVHYFKNFIRIFQEQGNEVLVTARSKEISHELLKLANIPFVSRGKGSNGALGKLLYIAKGDWIIYREARKFKPDIFLSFSSPYAAHVSSLMGKPHIAFDDTEHAKLGRLLYRPFTDLVLSPKAYNGKISKKQKLFDGYMELCYLHPNYFSPNPDIKDLMGLKPDEKFCLFRFVSWNANHDLGHNGINLEMKRKMVHELSKILKVFISSEMELPDDLKPYQFNAPIDRMHEALYYADLVLGESATMASESALLGTPAIYLDDIGRGYTDDLETHGLVWNFTESIEDQEKSLECAIEILQKAEMMKAFNENHRKLIANKIDVTQYLLEEVTNQLNK